MVREVQNVVLKYGSLDRQAPGYQEISCPTDEDTRLIVPPETLFRGITVNISILPMTELQQDDADASDIIQAPTDASVLNRYNFEIIDHTQNLVLESGFKANVDLELSYDPDAVSDQGWEEEELGIYYWKSTTEEWILLGGEVDAENSIIKLRVSYLHTDYAIMQIGSDTTLPIHNVKASPIPFTPGRGDSQFSNVKVSFLFSETVDSYEVKIFNMRGQLVSEEIFEDGPYYSGEAFWDGRNEDGMNVPGGVYLYQIISGPHVFTGSMVLLR